MADRIYRNDSLLEWDYDPEVQKTLYDALYHGALHATMEATAVEYFGNRFTYGELLDKIHACAYGLIKLGVKKGDYVTIFLPNIPQCLIAIYAVNRIGAVCNMLHPQSNKEELNNAIKLTNSKVILTFELNEEICSNMDSTIVRCKVPEYFPKNVKSFVLKSAYMFSIRSAKQSVGTKVIEWADLIRENGELPEETGTQEDVAAIMYTGGTTGVSKGAVLTNGAINYCLSRIILDNVSGIPHIGDRVLVVLPLFHAYGFILSVHSPLCGGVCNVLIPKFSPSECARMILENKIEYIMGVPSMYERMYPYFEGHDLSFVRQMLSGGDTISKELVDNYNYLLRNSNVNFRQGYGMTECCGGIFVMPAAYDDYKLGCVGRVFKGCEICVVEPGTDNMLPVGENGELCVAGPALMKGYLNNEAATKEVMHVHQDGKLWLHTGDLTYVDETGLVYFQSRVKRMVKIKGINVYPSQIENTVEKCDVVEKACAVGTNDNGNPVIKLYVVLKKKLPRKMTKEDSLEKIKKFASEKLNEWSIPTSIYEIDEMPMTKLQKVDFMRLEHKDD
ncbi:MAG TPA: class I adenylate-forming enzyme family protein [Methanocorpusculum sp.]|nr:class I adenylate-forming enzyme family protein [Methanocorpusculum sp.]